MLIASFRLNTFLCFLFQVKDGELKVSPRTKSAGVRGPDTAGKTGEGDVVTPVEVLQASETTPSPTGIQQDPLDTDPIRPREEGMEGVEGSGRVEVRSGVSGQLLLAYLEMEK